MRRRPVFEAALLGILVALPGCGFAAMAVDGMTRGRPAPEDEAAAPVDPAPAVAVPAAPTPVAAPVVADARPACIAAARKLQRKGGPEVQAIDCGDADGEILIGLPQLAREDRHLTGTDPRRHEIRCGRSVRGRWGCTGATVHAPDGKLQVPYLILICQEPAIGRAVPVAIVCTDGELVAARF